MEIFGELLNQQSHQPSSDHGESLSVSLGVEIEEI